MFRSLSHAWQLCAKAKQSDQSKNSLLGFNLTDHNVILKLYIMIEVWYVSVCVTKCHILQHVGK
jgi:hypothetical protein